MSNVLIMPFNRECASLKLLNKSNKPPSEEEANTILELIFNLWPEIQDEYISTVAKVLGSKEADIMFVKDLKILLSDEQGIKLLDCPLLQFKIDDATYETRLSISICIIGKSSKVWSRLTQSDKNNTGIGLEMNEIEKYRDMCHRVNQEASRWMVNRLKDVIKENSIKLNIHEIVPLEISSFGINDTKLEPFFTKLLDTSITMVDLLKSEEAKKLFTLYFNEVSGIKEDLLTTNNRDSKWLSIPITIEVRDGYMEPREVLFNRKSSGDRINYIGIAYDDSVHRNLAHWSVREMVAYAGKVEH